MNLIETKELKNFREMLLTKGQDFIGNLQMRRIDEIEYEPWEDYANAYKKMFSKFGKTTVTPTDSELAPRKNKYQFFIVVQLNDFQSYKLLIRKNSIEKYAYQNPQKAKEYISKLK